jgi:hypothetical protein
MDKNNRYRLISIVLVLLFLALACNLPTNDQNQIKTIIPPTPIIQLIEVTVVIPTTNPPIDISETDIPASPPTTPITETPTISHIMTPSIPTANGMIIYDVTSKDTAHEKRAPYGDSYQINRLERPFDKAMTYFPDLDIVTFNLKQDEIWNYVSIELVGLDPNNSIGIQYGVELDLNRDGFGDYIIVARPPYTPQWDCTTVKVYQDANHNTGGLSGSKSDSPLPGDGYENLIFDGGLGSDPDLAWVRINAGRRATVQFAFKRTLSSEQFMYGVLADSGFKDVGMLDYVDRFTRVEAGSPVRDNEDYPLKQLFSIDNTCREAYGFNATGYEPQLCPHDEPTPQPHSTPEACQPPPYCTGVHYLWDPVACICYAIPW